MTLDICLIILATLSASAIRDNFDVSSERAHLLLPYLGWTVLSAGVMLPAIGLSRSIWRFSSLVDYARAVPTAFGVVIGALSIGFLVNRLENVPRALPVLQGILIVVVLVGARVAFRLWHARRRLKPKMLSTAVPDDLESVLLVGVNRVSELFLHSVKEFAHEKVRVVGMLGLRDRQRGWLLQGVPVLGVPEECVSIANELVVRGIPVNRVVVTTPFDKLSAEAQTALLDLEREHGVRLDLFGERLLLGESPRPRPIGRAPAMEARAIPASVAPLRSPAAEEAQVSFVMDDAAVKALSRQPYWLIKRAIDIAASLSLLLALWPLLFIVAVLVAIDVGWPVTFWQQRPGLGGFGFRLYKFRTMRAAHDAFGKRIPDDQRFTPIGAFLRRTRLDELPQLIHILRGEMSFVGPRPLLPVDQAPEFAARLLVRPGMTGWAQVKGGRGISAADKAALDIWYVNNASAWLDLKILFLTIPMILVGERIDDNAIRRAWQELAEEGICKPPSMPAEHRMSEARLG